MIRFLAKLFLPALKWKRDFVSFLWAQLVAFPPKAYYGLAVLYLVRNVIAYFDQPSLRFYQFFDGDVTLLLIYQKLPA